MMDLLKRFEEEAAEDEEALLKQDGDDDAEEQALTDRLGEIDLGAPPVAMTHMWRLTTRR